MCDLASKTLTLTSLVAGMYHGYHEAKGIPLPYTLETTLTYAPALALGVFQATYATLGIRGTLGPQEKKHIEEILKPHNPELKNTALHGAIGGAMWGGVLTFAGYMVGWGFGKIK